MCAFDLNNILTQSQCPVLPHQKQNILTSAVDTTQTGLQLHLVTVLVQLFPDSCLSLFPHDFFSKLCSSPLTWALFLQLQLCSQSCANPWTMASLVFHSRQCLWAQPTTLFLLLLVPLTAPPYSAPASPSFHWKEWLIGAVKAICALWGPLACLRRSCIWVEQEFFRGKRAGRESQAGEQGRGALIYHIYPGINSMPFMWQSKRALLSWVSEIKTCDTLVPCSSPYLIPRLLLQQKCVCHPGHNRSEFTE